MNAAPAGVPDGPLARGGAPAAVREALAPSGRLRAVINLGNPVLAQGDPADPRGVTVAIARQLAAWLGATPELVPVPAARDAYAEIAAGRVDFCFLAIEPAREGAVAFTAPYALIEGVYLVRAASALTTAHEVDTAGVRVGVRTGSAYGLFLTRTITAADVVRGPEIPDVFEDEQLEVCAGIRQPLTAYAAEHGHRVLEPPFMEIRQAVGLPRGTADAVLDAVAAQVELLKSSGFIASELERSGAQAAVAPPAHRPDRHG
ncbi:MULTISPECIES: transporter substrate-binding domain-containing protein [unclassified Streptomyces]|uniref:transporter substrate-binding domain-containing protein n=1 Tax=unclassified Streptomyces TaxID=2593676 RepID=UPI002E17E7F2|nr:MULTISPECIES: transporter substrate-binding domain-containing protein [unclassified Streptomyces]